MKKQSLRIVVLFSFLAVLAASSSAQAQSAREMTASIPFSFVVGSERFPAGDYTLTRLNPQSDRAAMAIRSRDGRLSKIVQLTPTSASKAKEQARLVFTQYGEQYFLSQVWTPADRTGLELPKSRSERTLLARSNAGEGVPARRTTVALNARRR